MVSFTQGLVRSAFVAGILFALAPASASAQGRRAACPEGRTADGSTCIDAALAVRAKDKAVALGNARISPTGPALPPSRETALLPPDLLSRLFRASARHKSFGP